MFLKAVWDGMKTHISSKGTVFADLCVRGISADGTPDFEQVKLRTFNEEVIKSCQGYSQNDIIELDLTIRDATVEAVL